MGEQSITLRSGLQIHEPYKRLLEFCKEEYEYYDGISTGLPNAIEPMDVLVPVTVNAFSFRYGEPAAMIRSIHRGLKTKCDPLLRRIPVDAELVTYDVGWQSQVLNLLAAAVEVKGVSIAVATKVLHRKRRKLIPMLDSVMSNYYEATFKLALGQSGFTSKMTKMRKDAPHLPAGIRRAAEVLSSFRDDLLGVQPDIASVQQAMAQNGYHLSPVRILEILTWIEVEPRGHYRRP